jgi:hypothetical protein
LEFFSFFIDKKVCIQRYQRQLLEGQGGMMSDNEQFLVGKESQILWNISFYKEDFSLHDEKDV